ncbi:MAG: hypothetical protein ACOC1X_02700 [Promethearchaeota archaeon]
MSKCLVCRDKLTWEKEPCYLTIPNQKIRYMCLECYHEFSEIEQQWDGINNYDFWDLIEITRENIEVRREDPEYIELSEIRKNCFNCGKPIYFGDFYSVNSNKVAFSQAIKLWKSKYVQFFCCSCYENRKWRIKI